MSIRVCIAGATGWAGSALAQGVIDSQDMHLVSAVSRTHAGESLDAVFSGNTTNVPVFATVEEALEIPCDVFVEYTKPAHARQHVLHALSRGISTVVGTSGMSQDTLADFDTMARQNNCGVFEGGNFSLTCFLLQKFSQVTAQYIPSCEIIDYTHEDKIDSPSGTARSIAHHIGTVRESRMDVPLDKVWGPQESRGARLSGTQVHSVRLPGYVSAIETIFGLPGEKLSLRHEVGDSAVPFVEGALMGIRKVRDFVGLKQGMESVLDVSF